jgi:exoribonuclease R
MLGGINMTNNELVLKALSRPYTHTISDIRKITKLNSDVIINSLKELVDDNKLYVNDKKNLYYIKYEGVIEVKDKGFGFIKVDGIDEEFHVDEKDTLGALSGDSVEFYVLPKARNSHLDSAVVIKIVKHSNDYVYGLLCQKKNKQGISY